MIKKDTNINVLENNKIKCLIDIKGGRILSFSRDTKEFLSDKNINPNLYGSTFWPAPQSIWNWPPPIMLDEAEYNTQNNNNKLILISPADDILNIFFKKEFILTNNYLEINYIIKNISVKNIKVAPWEVTRVTKGGIAFFPKGFNKVWGNNIDLMKIKEENNIIWYKSELIKYPDHTKLFNNGKEGWLAYVQDDYIFIKQFEEILPKYIAPGEDGIEIYANPTDNYIELENIGKYEQIMPGNEIKYNVKWYIEKIDDNISVYAGNMDLVKLVRKILFNKKPEVNSK